VTETLACGRGLWVAGLLAVGVGSVLLTVAPRGRGGGHGGPAVALALTVFAATAWQVSAVCGTE